MPILIDFFNIFIVGIAENIIELYLRPFQSLCKLKKLK